MKSPVITSVSIGLAAVLSAIFAADVVGRRVGSADPMQHDSAAPNDASGKAVQDDAAQLNIESHDNTASDSGPEPDAENLNSLRAGRAQAKTRHCRAPLVTMILPADSQNPFWGPYGRFASAAAEDLGIELTLQFTTPNDRFDYTDHFQAAVTQSRSPDYIAAFPYFLKIEEMLSSAETAGVNIVTFNSGISAGDRKKTGAPRGRFENWLLHSQADDKQAGFDLAAHVTAQSRKKPGFSGNTTMKISAIGGNRDTGASTLRKDGLFEFIDQTDAQTSISQFVYTDWSYEAGRVVAAGLLHRYGKPDAIWTAALPLGKAAIDSWKERFPGEPQPAIGTIGWNKEALSLIENGDLAVTMGGHFTEGAWLLTLMHDHYNGLDFNGEIGLEMLIPLRKLDATNFRQFENWFNDQAWREIDFTQFSKCHTPSLGRYDFNLDNILVEETKDDP